MRALLDDISRASFDEQERIRTKQLATSLQSTLDQTMATMSQCQARVTRHSETLSNEESYSRNLNDNLQYRTRLADVQKLAQQIKDFRARLNDTVNFEDCQLKLQQLDRRRSEQQSKKDVYSGSIATNEQRCADLERDLKSDKFKDIDQKYRKKNIEFETTSMANKDLDKFYKALDKALMEFHSMKMQEINAVLSDLWRLTYKGTDIDEVVIKSDINDDGGDVAATGRKQYNYRVVMRSGDSELDMRGRCSAGQKVLASILIRLALAETFVHFLALNFCRFKTFIHFFNPDSVPTMVQFAWTNPPPIWTARTLGRWRWR
jgi:DNA repair protein RAD50